MSVDLIGAKAITEIANTINTALDPPSKEIGNYIADKIRYLRYGSLLKIVKKSEEKAKARGLALKMPPIKFFVPFCESAALEAEADEELDGNNDLRKMWENLLISAGSVATGESLYHLNILKNIGREEAKFFHELMHEGRADTYFAPLASSDATDARFLKESSFSWAFRRLPQNFEPKNLAEVIVRCAECSGILFEEICFLSDDGDDVSSDFSHNRSDTRRVPASVLRSLGVIEEIEFPDVLVGRWDPSLRFHADGYRVTNMGIRFFENCVGPIPKQSMSYNLQEDSNGHSFNEIVSDRNELEA